MRIAPLLALVVLGGCQVEWPATMLDQPALRPLEIARPAPPRSVPVGGEEEIEDREDVEDWANPRAGDASAAAEGSALFSTHCVACHGPTGHGDGPISEKMPPAPDLRHISICRRTDGFLYGTLTAGGRAMPPMREGLTPGQRWALVSFVRTLQAEGCTGSDAGLDDAGGAE